MSRQQTQPVPQRITPRQKYRGGIPHSMIPSLDDGTCPDHAPVACKKNWSRSVTQCCPSGDTCYSTNSLSVRFNYYCCPGGMCLESSSRGNGKLTDHVPRERLQNAVDSLTTCANSTWVLYKDSPGPSGISAALLSMSACTVPLVLEMAACVRTLK